MPIEDDECSDPPTSKTDTNTEKVRDAIHKDHHQSIQDTANTVGISYGVLSKHSDRKFEHEASGCKICAPLLTQDQKDHSFLVTP